ncbi:phosphonate C-P lyase system protein PhnG [Nodularia spumigena]|uniref:phosphonate C-P lyase system protein PhnG n=1 Tax=Nodularia spumigena TaxID=70799 RepID=UPI00232ED14C|nr:phosphonate C-P lyase system protein PhnG [Nodularia spumigena]MDB9305881.1 phosphonate C-P lyase system protein PhnG [Nodularia spumigena CS-591/12]MDB9316568.1 phosphonate C-P lyase system protein PhnG [Nodularia spumigena CS-590/01A]MDB9324149.1 phosphonate C-P lyase system protein PhnG [Nodularia spumigena CS-591/07A]MDB9325393.1 phosphonate C-P lyase system protein PhnG [Nodularia spumigena CS-590/02]MDB9331649.1 phosphonate C-P lyase system protein PhnG [Nodularia spumigena CS-591/04]
MATIRQRQAWMATLAKAEPKPLEILISKLDTLPSYSFLRSPEIGLAMVQGRVGGTGKPFNLGDMTITRCVVQLESLGAEESITGFGYVGGRAHRHAELAAFCDALLQSPKWHDQIQAEVIQQLQAESQQQQELKQRQTAATQVNFFTMMRGEG